MKVEELMIGDLVCVSKDVCIEKGAIVRVHAIDGDNEFHFKGLKGSATCVRVNDPDRMSGGIWTKYLEPLPLTLEILKKNEAIIYDTFARIDIGSYYIIYDYDGFLTICNDDDNERKISYIDCNNVHQLQHALRLCGIDKEIVI